MVVGPKFCEEDWSNLKVKYPSFHEEDLHRYCFSSAYIVALLHDSLGIALDDTRYCVCVILLLILILSVWIKCCMDK